MEGCIQQGVHDVENRSGFADVDGGRGPSRCMSNFALATAMRSEVGLSWAVVFGNRSRLCASSDLSEEVRHSGGSEDGENAERVIAVDAEPMWTV